LNITQENLDESTLRVKISLPAEDFADLYQIAIKRHRKNIALPGFRQGQVPEHLVRQRFGKTILDEALKENSFELLRDHLNEGAYKLYGSPILTNSTVQDQANVEDKNFVAELSFIVGLIPEFDLKFEDVEPVERLSCEINEGDFDKFLNNARLQIGQVQEVQELSGTPEAYRIFAKISGTFTLDDVRDEPGINTSEMKEGENYNLDRFIQMFSQKNSDTYPLMLGKKVGDVESFTFKDIFGQDLTENVIRKNLQLTSFEYRIYSKAPFTFEIQKIEVHEPAKVDKPFYLRLIEEIENVQLSPEDKESRTAAELEQVARRRFIEIYQRRAVDLFYVRLRDGVLKAHPIKMPSQYLSHVFYIQNREREFNNKFEFDNAWNAMVMGGMEALIINKLVEKEPKLKIGETEFEMEMRRRFFEILVNMEKNIIVGTDFSDPEEYQRRMESVRIPDKRQRELDYDARGYVREELKRMRNEKRLDNEIYNLQKEAAYNYMIANYIVVEDKKQNVEDFDRTFFSIF